MSDVDILELTQKQAAGFVGVSTRQFINYLKGPYPPPRLGNKKFRSDLLGAWLVERAIRENTVMNASGERLDPQQENARKNKELADKTALENELRRGELISYDEVRTAAEAVVSRIRSRLLRLPSTAAPLVYGVDDQIAIQETLDEMIHDTLSELSVDWTGTGDVEND